jgi:hypothetical protein
MVENFETNLWFCDVLKCMHGSIGAFRQLVGRFLAHRTVVSL